MDTLGSLCDKITIIKLKQYHSNDENKKAILFKHEKQLKEEINNFIALSIKGEIPLDKLTFESNKVYKIAGNETKEISGEIGEVFAELARVNCELWHEQEKVYEFENIPDENKNEVVKRLAILNLERNKCIDFIDLKFEHLIENKGV
jgi:hypothetical protein